MAQGANIEGQDEYQKTSLMLAAHYGHLSVVEVRYHL